MVSLSSLLCFRQASLRVALLMALYAARGARRSRHTLGVNRWSRWLDV